MISKRELLAWTLVLEGGLFLVSYAIGWATGRPIFSTLSWNLADIALGIVLTFPLLCLSLWVYRSAARPFRVIRCVVIRFLRPALRECSWFELLGVALAAGVAEEAFFRAAIQGTLRLWCGPVLAIFLASGLFGILHPVNWLYIVLVTFVGIYLGMIWQLQGNLLTVVVLHAVYDFIALIALRSRHRFELLRKPR